jgi:hypothetical protein
LNDDNMNDKGKNQGEEKQEEETGETAAATNQVF